MRGTQIRNYWIDDVPYSSCEDVLDHDQHEVIEEDGTLIFICIGRGE